GVMLTAQGPFINMRIGAAEWLIGLAVGLLLFAVLAVSLRSVARPEPPAAPAGEETAPQANRSLAPSKQLGAALLGDRRATRPDVNLSGVPAGVAKDRTVMTYLLPFEIVSVHLLVVLIGAAYLARAKRRRGAAQ